MWDALTLATTTTASGDGGGWDFPVILGIVLGVLALVVTFALRWWDARKARKRGEIRAELAGQMAAGFELLREVKEAGKNVPDDLTRRINDWTDATRAILDRAGPEYWTLFRNHVGLTFLGGTKHENYLKGSLRRLQEIIGSV